MDANNTLDNVYVGIDVSKPTHDVYFLSETDKSAYGAFDNDRKGYVKLLKWALRLAHGKSIHFCMEATGSYATGLAMYLAEHNHKVSVVNPHKTHLWLQSQGQGNKTDKADARGLAEYCAQVKPDCWQAPLLEVRELTAFVRHLDNLQHQATQLKNRLGEPQLPALVVKSLNKLLKQVNAEIEAVEKLIKNHIDKSQGLKRDRDLLVTIPGIADTTAAKILAELPDVEQFASTKCAARYAGLSPREYESGISIKKRTRLYSGGKRRLKTALYMPAMSAIRFNKPVRAIYLRLKEKGHKGAGALGAAMHKLLLIAVGVLRSQQPFRADYALNY